MIRIVNRTNILILNLLIIVGIILSVCGTTYAHPGRTDSSGGHTCYTNCEYYGLEYGEYHYHNGGSSGSVGPSEAAQGRIAGAAFAENENKARIESSATVEGTQQGETDGSSGIDTPYAPNDSVQHCSQEIKFTSTPSATYREAFQTIYTRTCEHVYDDAYTTAYRTANASAQSVYEEKKAQEVAAKVAQKKAEDVKNRNNLMLTSGAIGSAVAGATMWSKYRATSKRQGLNQGLNLF